MSEKPVTNWKLRLAAWWILAVIAGYFFFTVLSSRTVQKLLGR